MHACMQGKAELQMLRSVTGFRSLPERFQQGVDGEKCLLLMQAAHLFKGHWLTGTAKNTHLQSAQISSTPEQPAAECPAEHQTEPQCCWLTSLHHFCHPKRPGWQCQGCWLVAAKWRQAAACRSTGQLTMTCSAYWIIAECVCPPYRAIEVGSILLDDTDYCIVTDDQLGHRCMLGRL